MYLSGELFSGAIIGVAFGALLRRAGEKAAWIAATAPDSKPARS